MSVSVSWIPYGPTTLLLQLPTLRCTAPDAAVVIATACSSGTLADDACLFLLVKGLGAVGCLWATTHRGAHPQVLRQETPFEEVGGPRGVRGLWPDGVVCGTVEYGAPYARCDGRRA